MNKHFFLLAALALSGAALAKLTPLSPEAKAKADQAAARTAWQGKVDAYKLCQAQDRVAARYRAQPPAGKTPGPVVATPPCSDPGPFAYTPPQPKPIEQAGAHSPAATAATPHVTTPQTQGEVKTGSAPATVPATTPVPSPGTPATPASR